jgi:hypothetical protein
MKFHLWGRVPIKARLMAGLFFALAAVSWGQGTDAAKAPQPVSKLL